EDQVREDGAELGGELALLLVVDDGADDVGGQKVRRELDSRELRRDRVTKRADGERLREAGHAFEQHVTAREQSDEDSLDHVRLADDDLRDFVLDPVDERALARDDFVELPGVYHRAGSYHEKGLSRRAPYAPSPRPEIG